MSILLSLFPLFYFKALSVCLKGAFYQCFPYSTIFLSTGKYRIYQKFLIQDPRSASLPGRMQPFSRIIRWLWPGSPADADGFPPEPCLYSITHFLMQGRKPGNQKLCAAIWDGTLILPFPSELMVIRSMGTPSSIQMRMASLGLMQFVKPSCSRIPEVMSI